MALSVRNGAKGTAHQPNIAVVKDAFTAADWAQRVQKETFDKVAAEKTSSGLITNDVLGHKERGQLEPVFDTPVPGGAITDWND